MTLQRWGDIAAERWDSIVLGNGASIAVDPRFSYRSLFEAAATSNLVSAQINEIFKYFDTDDFEFVLRMLTHASMINSLFGVEQSAVSAAYENVRLALVSAVRNFHVSYEDAKEHLGAAGQFLSRFDNVVSLNYDLIVYWVMLAWNAEYGANWFKDCFVKGRFRHEWEYLRQPHEQAERATLVFYPHGNLAFAISDRGEEEKLVGTEKATLIESVFSQWQSGKFSPLFVSEGNSQQKCAAIGRSPYLQNVFTNALPNLGDNVVIYGWAMAEQDRHLVSAILGRDTLRHIAVSVRPGPEARTRIRHFKKTIREHAKSAHLQISLFDATSSGCWINPPDCP
jgi:hypothetical protein